MVDTENDVSDVMGFALSALIRERARMNGVLRDQVRLKMGFVESYKSANKRANDLQAEVERLTCERDSLRIILANALPAEMEAGAQLVVQAVAAERERCARIAEDMAGTVSATWTYPQAIATAIREQGDANG